MSVGAVRYVNTNASGFFSIFRTCVLFLEQSAFLLIRMIVTS